MFQVLIYEISDLDDHLFPYEYFHMRASLVAQMVKNPPVAPRFDTWVGKIPWRNKWQSTPYSCLENSKDRGAWWATVHGVAHGVAKSQTRLSDY